MGLLPAATTRASGSSITAASFNSDFAAIKTWADAYVVLTDTAKTVTGVITFSVAPIFSAAQTFGAGITVTTGGLTVTAGGLTVTAGGVTVTAGASTFGAGVTVTGTVTATALVGAGSGITSLNAAVLSGTLPALDGSALTALNATNIASGTIATTRLPAVITNATSVNTATVTASTAVQTPLVGGGSGQISLNVSDSANYLFTVGASGAISFTTSAPAGGTARYMRVLYNGVEYRILMTPA